MLKIESTPNHAGVTIEGDFFDFDQLYDALHEVVGEEDEYPSHCTARSRLLALCYELRHANMGHRGVSFVQNGLHDETRRWLNIVAPDKNVYLSTNVLWPELLFYTMALNDFVKLRAKKLSKNHCDSFTHKNVAWDLSLAQVRLFQASVYQCIEQTVSPTVLGRLKNMIFGYYVSFDHYTTQYVDVLNTRFLQLDKEQRLKNISIMVKRLVEKGDEYQEYRAAVNQAARAHDCSPDSIELNLDYPEEIDW